MEQYSNKAVPMRGNMLGSLPQPPSRRLLQPPPVIQSPKQPNLHQGDFSIEPSLENLLTDVICINCQEHVNIEYIEQHSYICTSISDKVRQLEEASPIEQVNYKILRLKLRIESLAMDNTLRPGEKNYSSILLRHCTVLGSVHDKTGLQDVMVTLERLSSLLATFNGRVSIRINAERLQALARELQQILESIHLEETKQEVDKVKEKINMYKNRAKILENSIMGARRSDGNMLGSINSDIGSFQSKQQSEISSTTNTDEQLQRRIQEDFNDSVIYFDQDQEQLRRYFYSQCLAIKMTFPSKSLAQKIPISEIYKKIQNDSIPPEDWANAITNILSNAQQILGSYTTNGRRKPRNSRLQQQFQTIQEEEA